MSALRVFVVLAWVVFAIRQIMMKPARVLARQELRSR